MSSSASHVTPSDEMLWQQQSHAITWMRFPLLMLMVLGHVYCILPSSRVVDWQVMGAGDIYRLIYNVIIHGICEPAVPAFFVLSGYLMFKPRGEWNLPQWKSQLGRRVNTLLVPYLLWSLIALLLMLLMGWIGGRWLLDGVTPVSLLWAQLSHYLDGTFINYAGLETGFYFPLNRPLWFVRDLMVNCLLAPVVWWLMRTLRHAFVPVVGALLVFDLMPNVLGYSTSSLGWWSLGGWLALNHKLLFATLKPLRVVAAVVTVLTIVPATCDMGLPSMAVSVLGGLLTASIIVDVLTLFYALHQRGIAPWASQMSSAAFFVYAIHLTAPIATLNLALAHAGASHNLAVMLACYVAQAAVLLLVSLACYWLCHRLFPRLTSLLTGRR